MVQFYSTFPHELETVLAIGLTPWVDVPNGVEHFIGEVSPSRLPCESLTSLISGPADSRTVIRCYVIHFPARIFRFVIRRLNDSEIMEEIEMRASGDSFAKFWPIALAFALDHVSVSQPKPVTCGTSEA